MMKKTVEKLVIFVALFFLQCTTDSDTDPITIDPEPVTTTNPGNTSTQEFDRSAMMSFWANNIILPAFDQFNSSLSELNTAVSNFNSNPSLNTLSLLRDKWLSSSKNWQYIEMFDIGRAEEIYFKNRMNLYPANVQTIENNIALQDFDLEASSNFAAQGFPAMDYLLFGVGSDDDQIVARYADQSLNYRSYLQQITQKMIDLTTEVKTHWEGDFRTTFIQSTENTATSSLNKLVNDFVFYFEKGYRANKFGIPAGVFSAGPLPDRIEAYHGQSYSKILAQEATKAIEQFFNGIAFDDPNTTGPSLKGYLDYIEADIDDKLSVRINEKFQLGKNKINALNSNFKNQIQEDNNAMLLTYDAIQSGVVLLKVDMLQKLNVSVDYADADGD